MQWSLFTGTWRRTTPEVEADVRAAVREVFGKGNGVLCGGATGVDFFALDEAMKLDPTGARVHAVIPTALPAYIDDYRSNWCHEPVTLETIAALEELLTRLKRLQPGAVEELPYTAITQDHYDLRDEHSVRMCDEVYAFQVNNSTGTQHTVDYAVSQGKPIARHRKYQLPA